MRALLLIACTAALAGLVPLPSARAQGADGIIDLDQSIDRQIAQLEQLVGGDAPAVQQAVVLQWLIDLYDAQGRTGDVERCYERILAFFPNDVPTLNAYGRYLMDTVGDNARARKVLYDAYLWSRHTDPRSLDRGTTYRLRAEVMRRMGDYEDAIAHADRALELLSQERSGAALRTKARSLEALGRYDEAVDVYLELIGRERGTNSEDINALKLIVSRAPSRNAGDVNRAIAEAIERQHKQYEARIELEGGELVTFESSDGTPLEGTLRRGDGPGAVLLVNRTGALRTEFTPYAQLLMIDGISSLSVDLRGHGGSRSDSVQSYESLSAAGRDMLADDVVAAYRTLQDSVGAGESHIGIIAAGDAAAIVEKALHRGRIDAPVAYLSPSFSDADPELTTALAFHADHPAFIVAAREDLAAMRAMKRFRESKPREQLITRLYPDAGHGLETLRRVPEALEHLQSWLRRVVGSS